MFSIGVIVIIAVMAAPTIIEGFNESASRMENSTSEPSSDVIGEIFGKRMARAFGVIFMLILFVALVISFFRFGDIS